MLFKDIKNITKY